MYDSIDAFRINAVYKIKSIMISDYKFEIIVNSHQLTAQLLHNHAFILSNYENFESRISKRVSTVAIEINKCFVIYFIYCRHYYHRDLRFIFQKFQE